MGPLLYKSGGKCGVGTTFTVNLEVNVGGRTTFTVNLEVNVGGGIHHFYCKSGGKCGGECTTFTVNLEVNKNVGECTTFTVNQGGKCGINHHFYCKSGR